MSDLDPAEEQAVRTLLARYCHLADDDDPAGVAALFTADGSFTFNGRTARGTDAIIRFLEGASRAGIRGKHLTTNTVVTAGGDVRAVSDFLFVRFTDGKPVPDLVGRYHDTLVRVDGQWRFAERVVHLAS